MKVLTYRAPYQKRSQITPNTLRNQLGFTGLTKVDYERLQEYIRYLKSKEETRTTLSSTQVYLLSDELQQTSCQQAQKRIKDRLFNGHLLWVAHLACKYAGQGVDMDELIQVGNHKLFDFVYQIFSPQTHRQFQPYLARSIKNSYHDILKSAHQRMMNSKQDLTDRLELTLDRPSPLQEVLKREEQQQLAGLIRYLSADDRKIIQMVLADEDSETIAKRLGIQVSAAHMRVSRAKKRLRILWQNLIKACEN